MAATSHPIVCGDTTAHIHGSPTFTGRLATSVLFLLHGYPANTQHVTPVVDRVLSILTNRSKDLCGSSFNNFFIVTLETNERVKLLMNDDSISEAERVYKTQEQLAATVSSLIDLLPRILHPNSPEVVNTWVVAGLGLGAHAAWMVMDRGMHPFPSLPHKSNVEKLDIVVTADPRLHACIPILGSPDFLDIATSRSLTHFPLLSSCMTNETREYILKNDPISRPASPARPNPFLNKQILAIVGAQDSMVPIQPTRQFLDRINVGPLGTKKLVIQEGVGHQCTQEMILQMAEFVWDVALS